MKSVLVYSTPSCHYCVMAKQYLKQKGVSFEEFDVSNDLLKELEMERKSGQQGVPVIDIEGKIIIGFNKQAIDRELGLN